MPRLYKSLTKYFPLTFTSQPPIFFIDPSQAIEKLLHVHEYRNMSASRVALVLVQAIANQLACTPPNPTPSKGRYHTDELYILQIAPFIFKCHQIIFWFCTTFEVLFFLQPYFPSSPLPLLLHTNHLICPSNPTTASITTTPSFIIGVTAVLLGSYIRLDCFKALGHMFTFDLTIHPEHKLITNRFYSYVRHPAYTGSLLLVGGLALSHLTRNSWLTECGGPIMTSRMGALVVWVSWWVWTVCVGVSRARAEDGQMRELFKDEWEVYAVYVPWWFFPGIV